MQNAGKMITCLAVLGLVLALSVPASMAAEKWQVTFDQWAKAKAWYDDPRPVFKDLHPSKFMPPDEYQKYSYDIETMKKLWADTIGFKAPDVVGKIAPEIKPGKYTYQDKEKYPGLKELMDPILYEKFKPGAPPHCSNFPEMEIVPTKQYYYALPVAETTKKNAGTVKQDEQGYMNYETYQAGIPFPRPSGTHKAIQCMYNWEKRYMNWENTSWPENAKGFNKNLEVDYDSSDTCWDLMLSGRCMIPPLGWYDERAATRRETKEFQFLQHSPRDAYGNVINITAFEGLKDFNQFLLYIAMLRRVRKLSGTDTQDIAMGADIIYEDNNGFSQKMSPYRFPYKYELIGEREFLFPAYSEDGSWWISSKGAELRGLKFERRPCYVIQLTQLDKNFVYGRRIIYLDAETFLIHLILNYDQKGRLYRFTQAFYNFIPEMGMLAQESMGLADYLDLHSSLTRKFVHLAPWVTRADVSLQSVIKKGK